MGAGAANGEIADMLDEVADLLELDAANPFRVRAYRNAARTVRGLASEVETILARGGTLPKLRGIGTDLAGKITGIARTGRLPLLNDLRGHTPAIATELLRLPGLGPKRVQTLCRALDLHTMEQLHRALLDGRVRELPGFGATVERNLLTALETRPKETGRIQLAAAERIAAPLVAWLEQAPGIGRVTVAGSYRRRQETVGDLDILAVSADGRAAVDHFTRYPQVARVAAAGTTRATVELRSGCQVDLRIVPEESFGAALHYFTGSKAHNIAVRRLGQQRGLKINEYGVFRGERRLAGATETEVYASVGLPYIEPELRENRGELEAAFAGRLPRLIARADLRGDLHTHTRATDGQNTLREMAEAARARGCFLELNAHPERLDLIDVHCRMAREAGVPISIATDAHRTGELDLVRFGVDQARRAWLEPADVVNSRPLDALRQLIARTM